MNTVLRNRRFIGASAKNIIVLFVDGKSPTWTSADAKTYKERLKALNTEVIIVTSKGGRGNLKEENGIKELTGLPDGVVPVNIGEETTNISDAINKLIVNANGKDDFLMLMIENKTKTIYNALYVIRYFLIIIS